MKRRSLDFQTIDEVIADVDRLHRKGYRQGGNWNLAQACDHLAIFVRCSMDGFTGPPAPWYVRLAAPLITRWMLKKRRMPEGYQAPAELMPRTEADETREVEELKQQLRRFSTYQGPLHRSPFGGDFSREIWHEMHLIHCAHHLSFLHPAEDNAGVARG
jgi:hypothetical protein